jgi:hypothetical protein
MFSLKRRTRELFNKGDYYSQVQSIIGDKKQYDSNKMDKKCSKKEKGEEIITLNCDSGKLLKYLLKLELSSYKDAKKKNKETKREDYLKIITTQKLNVTYLNDYIDKYIKKFQELINGMNKQLTIEEIINIIDGTQTPKFKEIFDNNYNKIMWISKKVGFKIGQQQGGGWKTTLSGLILLILGLGALLIPGVGLIIGSILIILGIVIICIDNTGCGNNLGLFLVAFMQAGYNDESHIGGTKYTYDDFIKTNLDVHIVDKIKKQFEIVKMYFENFNKDIEKLKNNKTSEMVEPVNVQNICIHKKHCNLSKKDKIIIQKIFYFFDKIFKDTTQHIN